MTPSIQKQIEKTLKSFSVEDIKKGIKNYSAVFHSPRTWWSYKWTLAEFLSREKGFEVFLEKGEKDYLTDTKTPFVDKAEEIKKSQDAEQKALEQKKKDEIELQNRRRENESILRWYESAPEGIREKMEKEIEKDYLIKHFTHPVLPNPEKGIKGDSPADIELKRNTFKNMKNIVTLKIASKYMQK